MHLKHSKLLRNTDYALALDLLKVENITKLARKDLWEESYLLQLGPRPSSFSRKGL